MCLLSVFFPSLLLVFSIEYLELWIVPETLCIWGRVRGSCPGHFQGTGTKACLVQAVTACIWRLLSQGMGCSCRVIWELQPWLVSKLLGQRNCSRGFWKLNSDPWGCSEQWEKSPCQFHPNLRLSSGSEGGIERWVGTWVTRRDVGCVPHYILGNGLS